MLSNEQVATAVKALKRSLTACNWSEAERQEILGVVESLEGHGPVPTQEEVAQELNKRGVARYRGQVIRVVPPPLDLDVSFSLVYEVGPYRVRFNDLAESLAAIQKISEVS